MEGRTSTKLGEYTLTHHLAHGGMSEVYLAHTENSERVYALKLVEQTDEEYYQRFQCEVQALYKTQHTHILPLLDYGEGDGCSYYVMPYIEEGTLKQHLRSGPLSLEEAGSILTQVGEALQFLHTSGVVHRDIKPANILLEQDGQAWLADLGLVKAVETDRDLTKTGCVIGTPSYMAPELLSQPASVSSDLYALGVVLYEMLVGHSPFDGVTPLEICWKHTTMPPPAPSMLNPLISPAVEQVILRALAKDPRARFSTVLEMVTAYQQALACPDSLAHPMLNWLADVAEAATIKSVPLAAPALTEQAHRRALIVAVLLSMLMLLGTFTLALEIHSLPGSSAQSIATYHIAAPVVAPTAAAGNASNIQKISIPTQSATPAQPAQSTPPTPPGKHHKHHGGGDD